MDRAPIPKEAPAFPLAAEMATRNIELKRHLEEEEKEENEEEEEEEEETKKKNNVKLSNHPRSVGCLTNT